MKTFILYIVSIEFENQELNMSGYAVKKEELYSRVST